MPTNDESPQDEFATLLSMDAGGDPPSAAIFEDLQALAGNYIAARTAAQRPESTALRAYVRKLASQIEREQRCEFLLAAAQRVRRFLLAAMARRNTAQAATRPPLDFSRMDDALTELHRQLPLSAQIIELHYFVGLDGQDISALLRAPPQVVGRELRFARAWLLTQLRRSQ